MTVEEARADWLSSRREFVLFGQLISARLERITKSLGIFAEISARAKDTPSLVKKLLKKPHLSYETLPDRVGARVLVRFRCELPLVERRVREAFDFASIEDKSGRLGTDKVGYQSIHIDALSLKVDDPDSLTFPPDRFFGELQIRTLAQHLWSDVSHDSFYKNDEMVQKLPFDLQRRINLTAGMVEIADREFDRMNDEAKPSAEVQMFNGLERIYYSVASMRPDIELSLEVIAMILPLYGNLPVANILNERIYPQFEKNRSSLEQIYSNPDLDRSSVSAVLFQPEAFLLLDRLHEDRDQLHKVWNARFPESELDRFSLEMGFSLD